MNCSPYSSLYYAEMMVSCHIYYVKILFKINELLRIDYEIVPSEFYEANLLMLNADKAKKHLSWKPVYDIDHTLKESINWYNDFINKKDIIQTSQDQYKKYMEFQNE